jgi:Ca2+-binding RTX toxin-like protein
MSGNSSAPLNGIVYITDTIGADRYQASGVLIAPDLVLTAAHVVWQEGVGSATNITVSAGYNLGAAPFGQAYGLSYDYNPVADAGGEETLATSQSDYALIKLTTPVTGATDFALGTDFSSGVAYVSGYPASANGGLVSPAQNLFQIPGLSILVGQSLGAGSSGGPVWALAGDGTPTVYGLVSTENGGTGFNVQMTQSSVAQIDSWAQQLETPQAPIAAFDTTTGSSIAATGTPYVGPVAGLQNTYANITTDGLNILATTPNWFIATGSGNDAITVTNGNNVVDGGSGSNFLTGGIGNDTFFVNATPPNQDIWSTVVHFHQGDFATLWGVSPVVATSMAWANNQGANGYTGLTLHATTVNGTSASLTLAGYSTTDLSNGRLAIAYGVDAHTGPYMLIAGTG